MSSLFPAAASGGENRPLRKGRPFRILGGLFLAGGLLVSALAPPLLRAQEPPTADLSVRIPLGPATAVAGATIAFTVEVGNAGPDPAAEVQLGFAVTPLTLGAFREAHPSRGICVTDLNRCVGLACLYVLGEPLEVDCALGELSPGETVTVQIRVVANAAAGTVLEADAVAQSPAVSDPDGENNSAVLDTRLLAPSSEGEESGGGGCFLGSLPRGKKARLPGTP